MDDAGFGALLRELLEESHHLPVEGIPALVARAARELGLDEATVYLADVQQERLVPLGTVPDSSQGGLPVDATLAGWAYRTVSLRVAEDGQEGLAAWLPMMDGIERIGVLGLHARSLDGTLLGRCRALASLTTLLLLSRSMYSDTYLQATRARPMRLPAEMVWAFLPPRTVGTRQVTSSAVMEPAYDIGGDAFDHSLSDKALDATVIDAMGHDLASGLAAAVGLAGCRVARRAGGDLKDIVETIDHALAQWLPHRYLTAVFAHLDLASGQLRWANCGHPPPLLIRGQHVISGALEHHAELPLGLGPGYPDVPRRIHHAQLEPGDRVLLHTDGVTEARSGTGEVFGERRFTDFVIRAIAAGEPTPEALRRLLHAVLDHRRGQLDDDATILLFEWHPPSAEPTDTSGIQTATHLPGKGVRAAPANG
ncbi:PP2C family protein-serine/threonine phosphatase [Streptomyces silvisoli]|uniref:PP2C family protein-serine/threonine phosphatase n=1 Tax=Streptomyces silvisoli TaxID=3034235 RepID=A0ABT5ZJQ1_9ACTN|nr:PP2C family protein-serine/threonine phosphatase [Streptomyces silvisoli]MDF3289825.1 PP2C family protein-serine/threonine phosphatase [Streptomyces silvisoli]